MTKGGSSAKLLSKPDLARQFVARTIGKEFRAHGRNKLIPPMVLRRPPHNAGSHGLIHPYQQDCQHHPFYESLAAWAGQGPLDPLQQTDNASKLKALPTSQVKV